MPSRRTPDGGCPTSAAENAGPLTVTDSRTTVPAVAEAGCELTGRAA